MAAVTSIGFVCQPRIPGFGRQCENLGSGSVRPRRSSLDSDTGRAKLWAYHDARNRPIWTRAESCRLVASNVAVMRRQIELIRPRLQDSVPDCSARPFFGTLSECRITYGSVGLIADPSRRSADQNTVLFRDSQELGPSDDLMRHIVERCATQSGPAERSILAVYRTCQGAVFQSAELQAARHGRERRPHPVC